MKADQKKAPILEAIESYHESQPLPFRVPGHKLGAAVDEQTASILPRAMFRADIPALDGLDDRRESKKVQKQAEALAAELIGAETSHFSVNGSSLSAHVMVLAAAAPGEKILIARNTHRSMIAATILAKVQPIFLTPDYDVEWDLEHGVSPAELEGAWQEHPDAKGAIVVNPSYFGVSADLKQLADICHKRERPLLVDEAWGAHLPFHPAFPSSAMASGADLSCNSYHKTMTSLGQASIVNRRGGLIPDDRFKLVFDLFQTTSPSSLILGSIDGSRRLMAARGEELWGKVVDLAAAVRAELEGFNGLRVLRAEDLHSPGAFGLDPIKVTFDVSELGITGYEANDWLVENHHLRLELSDHRHLIALLTTADDAGTVARLIVAMRELTKAPRKLRLTRRPTFPPAKDLYAELVMTPAEAVFGKTTHVALRSAIDRIVAENVSPYPPGIPRLVPGERVTEAIVEYLELGVKEGMFVEDAADPTLATLRVVA